METNTYYGTISNNPKITKFIKVTRSAEGDTKMIEITAWTEATKNGEVDKPIISIHCTTSSYYRKEQLSDYQGKEVTRSFFEALLEIALRQF